MGPMLAPWTLLPGYLFMKMMSFLGAILYHCYIIYAYNALGNICEHKINKNFGLNFCEIWIETSPFLNSHLVMPYDIID